MATARTMDVGLGAIGALIPSWERSLRAANKSPRTVRSYGDSARLFAAFAAERLGVTDVTGVTREAVETFVADQLERFTPGTAAVRYRRLQQMFKWAVEEGEITASPMASMHPPTIPQTPVPVVSDDDLRALLQACAGRGYAERRDTAPERLFLDTGCRLGEVAGLKVDDVDFDAEGVSVVGGGAGRARSHSPRDRRRTRQVPAPAKSPPARQLAPPFPADAQQVHQRD